MTREQNVAEILRLLTTEYPYPVTERDRKFLQQSSDQYLDRKLGELRSEVAAKHRQQQAKTRHNFVTDPQAAQVYRDYYLMGAKIGASFWATAQSSPEGCRYKVRRRLVPEKSL